MKTKNNIRKETMRNNNYKERDKNSSYYYRHGIFMETLYQRMGFNKNPFQNLSAEQEISYIEQIYYNPSYFTSIFSAIKDNNTNFIFGNRGSGKSALMFKIIEELQKEDKESEKNLSVLIDNYSSLLNPNTNLNKYYILLIKAILRTYMTNLLLKQIGIERLDKINREKLAVLIENFYTTISKTEFDMFRTTHKLYNEIINPTINSFLNTGVGITSDFIAQSLGLKLPVNSEYYREYLPKIKITDSKMNIETLELGDLEVFLENMIEIVKASGYETIAVLMDKIDEQAEVGGKIDAEVQLLIPLLTKNNLLLNGKFGFNLFLWSKLKTELSREGVRFDKIKPIDVTWTSQEMVEIIQKRIKYFSDGKVDYYSLFEDKTDGNKLIQLSNNSPRDLITLLSFIYYEEEKSSKTTKTFSKKSVETGITTGLYNYNFYSAYPTQRGSRQDIRKIIYRLKRVQKDRFKIKDLITTFKITQPAVLSFVTIMKDYGVIGEDLSVVGSANEYIILDPKIAYIVKNQLEIS